ncbi:phosphoribulokinase [Virgibacillus sp. NKC19-3]|uniref:uridine kinase family protein n=1 Tax=Virgibacillus saliphilus TaxID=2831674 RepID=UPI001C9ACA3E|nr:phosphoribulokinase [Virgibacillus sp. NKC19-3]MBY7144893.1 phosphoribulokinase [Virgibacillus sp. NKC19-3]
MDKIFHGIVNLIHNTDQKVIIGISGHGASGKTTFANKRGKLLGQKDVNYINTDPYIIGSNLRKYTILNYQYNNKNHHYKMTACHPAAHNVLGLERDIHMIRDELDFYTIGTPYMRSTLIHSQSKVNIVEGMSVAFINPHLFDLRIYLYTDSETELIRRGIRDASERGADIHAIRQSHEERRIQYDLFMHPYHCNFDIILKNANEAFFLEKGGDFKC